MASVKIISFEFSYFFDINIKKKTFLLDNLKIIIFISLCHPVNNLKMFTNYFNLLFFKAKISFIVLNLCKIMIY